MLTYERKASGMVASCVDYRSAFGNVDDLTRSDKTMKANIPYGQDSLCPPWNYEFLDRLLFVELYREHLNDFFSWNSIHY